MPDRSTLICKHIREIRRYLRNTQVDVRVRCAFGRRLRVSRTQLGYTLKQLARDGKCSWLFLVFCERGLIEPRLLTLLNLAHALNVDPGDLVQGLGQDYKLGDD